MLVVGLVATIAFCVGVGSLIFEHLEKTVEQHSEQSAEKRSHPVDPMVAIEAFGGNIRAE